MTPISKPQRPTTTVVSEKFLNSNLNQKCSFQSQKASGNPRFLLNPTRVHLYATSTTINWQEQMHTEIPLHIQHMAANNIAHVNKNCQNL
ncbi:hypothetical protein CEXT_736641 [Caerostris extrusa]|uniref:Uncharacterized protein n=1 Tax=Caerostris extrusa TaxID=172846 RepID=A0AAV4V260_CAEEX|nr:hypothetical protein CEXT_736641 [Caerostris extrusa]